MLCYVILFFVLMQHNVVIYYQTSYIIIYDSISHGTIVDSTTFGYIILFHSVLCCIIVDHLFYVI